jgi:hypothetical protein
LPFEASLPTLGNQLDLGNSRTCPPPFVEMLILAVDLLQSRYEERLDKGRKVRKITFERNKMTRRSVNNCGFLADTDVEEGSCRRPVDERQKPLQPANGATTADASRL